MSYSKCRCTEIRCLSEDIQGLSNILVEMGSLPMKASKIMRTNELLAKNEASIYVGGERITSEVANRTKTLAEDIDKAINAISDKITELNSKKAAYEADDREYHEEQKKLEAEKKNEQ